MAFRKKAGHILAYKPDILIVPECECPDNLKFGDDIPKPDDMLWFGENLHKGLGIFSYSGFRLKRIRNHNPDLKIIIPVSVTGNGQKFNLFAIWANNPTDPDGQYVEQVWKAIQHYNRQLSRKKTILIGDFNSNTIWDRKYRVGNHSHVVDRLKRKGIFSAYHTHYIQQQGNEAHPTYYLYRHKDKPYHLDYCFVSADLAVHIRLVEIGDYDFWIKYSDHVPLIVTIHDE